jgi:hypothetical protein
MPLIQSGKITAIRKGEFDGKPFASLQFVETDRFGGVEIRTVYLPENHNVSQYAVGADVDLPVTVSVNKKTGGIACRLIDDVAAQSAPRPVPTPAPRPKVV